MHLKNRPTGSGKGGIGKTIKSTNETETRGAVERSGQRMDITKEESAVLAKIAAIPEPTGHAASFIPLSNQCSSPYPKVWYGCWICEGRRCRLFLPLGG
jgi:hypothetical protein